MDEHGPPLLDVRDLTTEFVIERGGARHIIRAVDGVSFHIRRGEIVGLVGESGSGKSVTALSIIRPSSSSPIAPR